MKDEDLLDMNRRLKEMIQRTSEEFEFLVKSQEFSLTLHYSKGVQYLSLVRQKDSEGNCVGLTWKRYRPSSKGRVWLKGWSVPNTPAGMLTSRMYPNDALMFKELHGLAKEAVKLRKELVSKKRRVQATYQAIKTFEGSHMKQYEQKRDEIFI